MNMLRSRGAQKMRNWTATFVVRRINTCHVVVSGASNAGYEEKDALFAAQRAYEGDERTPEGQKLEFEKVSMAITPPENELG